MRTIRLYGELGQRFGRVHCLTVANAAEAIRALRANYPEFERALLTVAERYRVIVGRRRLGAAEEMLDPSGESETIRIIPVVQGAKRAGFLQAILGIAMITVGVLFPTPFSSYLVQAGTALLFGGIAQMLTPVPKLKAGGQEGEQKASYVFSGAVNVTAQGVPVPVGYGRMIVGSVVISAGLNTAEEAL